MPLSVPHCTGQGPPQKTTLLRATSVAPRAYRPPRDGIKMQVRSGVQDSEFLTNSQVIFARLLVVQEHGFRTRI